MRVEGCVVEGSHPIRLHPRMDIRLGLEESLDGIHVPVPDGEVQCSHPTLGRLVDFGTSRNKDCDDAPVTLFSSKVNRCSVAYLDLL